MMDKFNSEGYADLTAYEALMKIEQEERAARKAANFRPLVYICSPYSGNTEFNANNARIYSRFAVAKGAIPNAVLLFLWGACFWESVKKCGCSEIQCRKA